MLEDKRKSGLLLSYNISVISSDCSEKILIAFFCLMSNIVKFPFVSPALKIFSSMNFTFENSDDLLFVNLWDIFPSLRWTTSPDEEPIIISGEVFCEKASKLNNDINLLTLKIKN